METAFQSVKELVEKTIRGLGVDPDATRVADAGDRVSFSLKRGSARIVVSVAKREGLTYFRVAALVLEVAAEAPREALYKRLLELNASGLVNAAFGLDGERVVLVSERPAAGLDGFEVDQIIRHVAAVADLMDDRLAQEFGGKRGTDAK